MCQMLHFALQRDSFIVSEEDNMFGGRVRPASLFRKLAAHSNSRSRLDLVRWRPIKEPVPTTAITVHANVDLSRLTAARANLSARHRLLIITPYPASSALKQLVKCWRKDKQRNNVLLVTINHEEGNHFFLDDLPDIELAFAILDHVSVNIFVVKIYHRFPIFYGLPPHLQEKNTTIPFKLMAFNT